jgi:LuxR family maltose regulon positive regulatory protein
MVLRSQLWTNLEHNITQYRLVLFSAPAGYGKTTLLTEWARASSMPVTWLSVTREDDDVERFLRYLLAAWKLVKPDIAETPFGILLGSQMPEIEAVLAALINAAEQAPDHLAFVLDDYHVIEDPGIHDALTYMLDHLPAKLHIVLTCRSDPPLPLARYRARGQLLEIKAEDLVFTQAETTDFLIGSMGLELTSDEVTSIHKGTEGWIAGLQLAALALRRWRNDAEGTPLVSGRQRFIVDYLREEILDQLPAEERDFLLRTSILDRLCGSLCNAITGGENGQAMLAKLERENLFIVPLDERREWFRYHSLFDEFLVGELKDRLPVEVNRLHTRAARWCAAHDLDEQALVHAAAGEDGLLLAQIAEPYVHRMLLSGQLSLLDRWLGSVPEAWYADFPFFGFARACLYAIAGPPSALFSSLEKVEQRLAIATGVDVPLQMAKVKALRCAVACFQNDLGQAETYADQALHELPEKDHIYRAMIFHALGDTYRRIGRWEQARDLYLKVLKLSDDPTYRVRSVHVFGALADLDLRQGRLREAAAHWQRALAEIPEQKSRGSLPLPVIGWVFIRMGDILYEWNQLREASGNIARGLEHVELGGDVQAMIAGYLISGRLNLTQGDVGAAAAYLEQARQLVDKTQLANWTSRFERLQLDLWLAQGRHKTAIKWCDEILGDAAHARRPEDAAEQLTLARALILKEDKSSLDEALARLAELLEAAEGEGRMGVTIESLTLQALALWRRGDRADALTSLEHALSLAEPEGYVRLFVDLGLPMGRLLQEARSRAVRPDYVRVLLDAFDTDLTDPVPAQMALPEPLTPREHEVLALIASGLTNREIAEKLVVSPGTVKKHTGNIYGKLGVSNRTQAVSRARELDMLA